MAKIVVCPNILDTETVEHYSYSGVYIDWLQEHYPNGFNGLHVTSINLTKLKVRDYDKVLNDSDLVLLVIYPGDPYSIGTAIYSAFEAAAAWWAAASALTKFIVGTIISMSLSYLANNIFGTAQVKQGKIGSPSPTYDLSAPTNQARLGQPIPVIYGTVVTVPDLAATPYRWYDYNDMWVGLLFCIGQGWHQINEVRISGTPVSQFAPDNFWYSVYSPRDDYTSHNGVFGTIQNSFFPGKFFENVYTAPEVTDQEIVSYKPRGPFIACPPGSKTSLLGFDIEFPRGLYAIDDKGHIYPWGAYFILTATPIDDFGNEVGASLEYRQWYSTFDNSGAGYTTPKRFTIWWTVPNARYKCIMNRTPHCDTPDNCDDVNDATMIFTAMWTGLKSVLSTDNKVYNNTTLIAVVARATNGFSQNILNTLTVNCTRRLPDFRDPVNEGLIPTNSHSHAFYDIYRNSWYGANRPRTEVDIDALERVYLRTYCEFGFNAVIDSRTTVWEALSLSMAGVHAFPITNGAAISVVEDIAQEVATQCFNESNIVKDSLKISYKFNDLTARDGVEIEYRDPSNFEQKFALTPDNSIEPESINLLGCTNAFEAKLYAERIWRQRQYRREFIRFSTELEGNLPLIGSLISVEHSLLNGPTCYTVGSITPESDFTVTIEGHKYNSNIFNPGKKRRIINIPAIREGVYDLTNPSVGYARGITVSGYETTDVVTLTLPVGQQFVAWSPYGIPNNEPVLEQAYFYMSYDDIKHMCDLDFDWSVIIVFMDGQRIDIWEGDCECCAQTPEEIQYLCNTYWPGVFNTTIIVEDEVTGHKGIKISRASGALGSSMSWAYTYFYHDYNDHYDLKTGTSYTQNVYQEYAGSTNYFRVLQGPNATSYTEFGTNGGLGHNGQFYNGYEAARAAFVTTSITGHEQYTFVIEDGYFPDNTGGLSIQLEVL